jgi:hypothetical protein
MISNPAPLHPGTVLAEIWVRMQRTKGSDSWTKGSDSLISGSWSLTP